MDTQLDDLAIRSLLIPLQKQILIGLKNKVLKKQRVDWYEIYLTVFILMCNFERVFGDVLDYTTRHGIKVSWFRLCGPQLADPRALNLGLLKTQKKFSY